MTFKNSANTDGFNPWQTDGVCSPDLWCGGEGTAQLGSCTHFRMVKFLAWTKCSCSFFTYSSLLLLCFTPRMLLPFWLLLRVLVLPGGARTGRCSGWEPGLPLREAGSDCWDVGTDVPSTEGPMCWAFTRGVALP